MKKSVIKSKTKPRLVVAASKQESLLDFARSARRMVRSFSPAQRAETSWIMSTTAACFVRRPRPKAKVVSF